MDISHAKNENGKEAPQPFPPENGLATGCPIVALMLMYIQDEEDNILALGWIISLSKTVRKGKSWPFCDTVLPHSGLPA